MGLLGRAKDAVGMGDDGDESIAEEEEWGSEVDVVDEGEELGDEDFEEDVDQDPELDETWDSAYMFVGDMVTKAGFTDMVDFIDHAMYHEIEKSPMYRDRIQSGVQTMNQISTVKQEMQQVSGESGMDLESRAETLSNANQVISEVEKLKGEDEQFMREVTGLAREYANLWKNQQRQNQPQGGADVTAEETGERL
jgi:tRNA uridine 5-carbamoylmethylation protein Kti12